MAALGFDVKPDHLNTRLRLRKYSNRKENLVAERLNPKSNLVGVVEYFPSSKKTEERTLFFTGETEALGISVNVLIYCQTCTVKVANMAHNDSGA